jgi:predicted PurR-regulated permease PerM
MKTRDWQMAALAVATLALIYWLGPVLTPFAVAALIAYLGNPLVERMTRWKLSRSAGVGVVFASMTLFLALVVLVLVPVLQHQISHFFERLPDYIAWIRDVAVPWIAAKLGMNPDEVLDSNALVEMARSHWKEAGGFAAGLIATVSRSGFTFVTHAAELLVIPVVSFYLMRDWPDLVERVHELIPRSVAPTIERLAREADDVLGAFLRGQMAMVMVLGGFYSLGLWAVGIDLAVLIGMCSGLVSFIPYLGAISGVAAGVIAAFVQYHDWLHVALVLGVFWVGHMLEAWVLAPNLVGDRIGLHPVAVIFAVLVGGHLYGFLGILLALPVAAVAMVLLRHAHERYLASALYETTPQEVREELADDAAADALMAAAEEVPVAEAAAPAAAPDAPK